MFGGNSKDADTRTRTMLEKLHTIGGEEEIEDQDDEAIDEDGNIDCICPFRQFTNKCYRRR